MLVGLTLLALLARVSVAVELHAINHWAGGFQVELTIPICTELDGWTVHLTFDEDVDSLEVRKSET